MLQWIKKYWVLLFISIYSINISVTPLAQAADSNRVCNTGSQLDMNICVENEYHKVDKDMNASYSNLVESLKDPIGIKNSQLAWLKYRDSECSNKVFQIGEGGSLLPYTTFNCLIELTNERIKRLKWHLSQDCNGCPPMKF